jgi:cell division protease FtsH
MGHGRDYSDELAEKVDAEVRALIEQAHTEAWKVLNSNRKVLDKLAAELLEKETLDHNQLAEIFKSVKKLPKRPEWLSSTKRPSSKLPPVTVPKQARNTAARPVGEKAEVKAPAKKKAVAKKPAAKKPVATKPAAKPAAKKPAAKK